MDEDDLEKMDKLGERQESTEMAELFDSLDHDEINPETGLSRIDMNTNINDTEIKGCLIVDQFRSMGILRWERADGVVEWDANITHDLKRNKVSEKGWGRELKTRMFSSDRDKKMGLFGSLGQGGGGGGGQ